MPMVLGQSFNGCWQRFRSIMETIEVMKKAYSIRDIEFMKEKVMVKRLMLHVFLKHSQTLQP